MAMDKLLPKLQTMEAAVQERIDNNKSAGELSKSVTMAAKVITEVKQLMKEGTIFTKSYK